ncbi:Pkinase-domain-containing protein [Suhomyces tanzawaensis NRRL Y-17324]|uniref:Pkinase-domain-containing protein n=1 Tax=Suhomyces tanzawaensis NRRL Y-17324 TaxID=984487 RepID=A0A1E4SGX7_9ASCO|nr:Pkinase-domain-containing protein [Suhomyces tanzawaensis NRRL Y-17324]ODV78763.1 Pkinase-domain-containing protein [Suhomyces tanzawaensis NRRL Y-17324]
MSLSRKRILSFSENAPKRQVRRYENIARLYSTRSGQSHIVIPRKPTGVVIGRSSLCDIKIVGSDVSSKHCQLTLTINNSQEHLYITDLSSNGLYINDELCGKGTNTLLKSGDKVGFAKTGGQFIFRYSFDEEEGTVKTHKRTFFDDYILGNQLGSGHYAVVKEARDRTTGDIVAVKVFHPNKSSNGDTNDAKLQQEMNLLLSINHPNIVKFISHYIEPLNQNTVSTYLVLEKMNNGELFQRIVNKLKLRQDETKAIFKQLLSGVHYLHENNIIHRDIKPENILLDVTPRTSLNEKQTGPWDDHEYDVKVKIADFGLAKFIGELKFTNTLCGTPAYVAPEILLNDRNYSTKVDLWLAGVLLYVCLCGFPPFSDELAPPNMKDQILQGKYAFYSPYWDDISDSALDLISNLLVVDARDRFDIVRTCHHFWFGEADQQVRAVSDTEEQDMEEDVPSQSSSQVKRQVLRSNTQPMTLKERFTSELNFGYDRSSIL